MMLKISLLNNCDAEMLTLESTPFVFKSQEQYAKIQEFMYKIIKDFEEFSNHSH